MNLPRISASSYSNTAPLIWSFLYGSQRGKAELILDNAPARSAELLATGRVDAALVPVIAYQTIPEVRLFPDVCVGSLKQVRSVCLVTNGQDLGEVGSVALDVSSKTSVALTKIVFREFLGHEPVWAASEPDADKMLQEHDCALLIGDPALSLNAGAAARDDLKIFDLAEIWNRYTGTGFVFAMWMAKKAPGGIDLAAARDEGLSHVEEIIMNYSDEIPLDGEEFRQYLANNITYSVSEKLEAGMNLFFDLCGKHGLIEKARRLAYV
ncbi:MAG: menaquinone biosynthesis protein [Acidobacteriota bacterium]|nr:MAG: menaquinone biosynthesis protein [Acidobacteriota bacterium]